MERSVGCGKSWGMQIVTVTPDRYAAIVDLNRAAFGSDAEGALIIPNTISPAEDNGAYFTNLEFRVSTG